MRVGYYFVLFATVLSLQSNAQEGKKKRPVLETSDVLGTVLKQYIARDNNYSDASEFCFMRAHKMSLALIDVAEKKGVNLKGKDGVWGTADDLLKKVIIRYPASGEWDYHIATCYKQNGEWQVCDPIRGNIIPRSVEEWARDFAHDAKVEMHSITDSPPENTCYVDLHSILTYAPDKIHTTFEGITKEVADDQWYLDRHIRREEQRGSNPYPEHEIHEED